MPSPHFSNKPGTYHERSVVPRMPNEFARRLCPTLVHQVYWKPLSSPSTFAGFNDPAAVLLLFHQESSTLQTSPREPGPALAGPDFRRGSLLRLPQSPCGTVRFKPLSLVAPAQYHRKSRRHRSEERRIGKECRSRWS